MKTLSAVTRKRLEMQGFVGLDDATLTEAEPWLRLAPVLCAIWAGVATWRDSPVGLWMLIPFAALGAVWTNHPFDALYNFGIRHLLHTRPLPRYGVPRRFACAVATVWLGAAGWAFHVGAVGAGRILGWSLVGVALLVATTNFCIPSLIYSLFFGKPASCRQ